MNRAPSSPRTALVTGASRGLGLTLARFLAVQGYQLVITARHDETLAAAARELSRLTTVRAIAGDVADPDHRRTVARAVGSRLDLLVNNASDLGATPRPHLEDYDLDRLRRLFEVNVIAPLALVQETIEALRTARGSVVNITSDAARGGYSGWGGYGSSKAALELIGSTLANELDGIAVVNVDPGDLRTEMQQAAFPGEDISDRKLPEATIPFWTWLLEQDPKDIDGLRFEAQAEVWEFA